MLVVISDLHFQDTVNDAVTDANGNILANADRNVQAEAFRMIFQELFSVAESNSAGELIIVLAGDIFDLNRSSKWFGTDIRPYGDIPDRWGPVAVDILNSIIESNKQTLDLFTTLVNNKEIAPAGPDQDPIKLFKDIKLEFIYIPGNHDRLVNLHTPLIKKVRHLLGQDQDVNRAFQHEVVAQDYGAHIRHGHEYDSTCFAGGVPQKGPLVIDEKDYASPNLGDYVTIDFAARLAHTYRRNYEKNMVTGPDADMHRLIYRRLLEFDDLRPQSGLIAFLEAETDGDKTLEFLSPVISEVIAAALKSSFLQDRLGRWKMYGAKILSHFLSPKDLFSLLMKFAISSSGPEPWLFAKREPVLADPNYRYIVAGHTHNPDVEFLSSRGNGQQERETFFFDTGTWRQQIRQCCDGQTFSKAKALTYVIFYRPDEDPAKGPEVKKYSFDYWSGFTKKEFS
jgi:hypothetical protein